MIEPAILHTSYVLAHAPDFVRYGSKPTRELESDPSLLGQIDAALRSWDEVIAYPPHQVFIGNLTPDDLAAIPRPWFEHLVPEASTEGPFGRIIPEAALYGLMKLSDDFELLTITTDLATVATEALGDFDIRMDRITGVTPEKLAEVIEANDGLALYHAGAVAGFIRTAHDLDPSLDAHVLFENLITKATAVLAVAEAFDHGPIDPEDVDYLLNTGEEAVGDRYQRGGGSLSKAVGEVVGCLNATGSDIKAFCAAPVHALIMAGAMVAVRPLQVRGGARRRLAGQDGHEVSGPPSQRGPHHGGLPGGDGLHRRSRQRGRDEDPARPHRQASDRGRLVVTGRLPVPGGRTARACRPHHDSTSTVTPSRCTTRRSPNRATAATCPGPTTEPWRRWQ